MSQSGKEKMKIVFLSSSHIYNDTRVLLKEAKTLAAHGHEVVHLAPGAQELQFVEVGVEVYQYIKSIKSLGRIKTLLRLIDIARRYEPDAVHCNEIDSWAVGVLLKLLNPHVFVVFDVHEHYPSRFDEPHVKGIVRIIGKPLFSHLIRILSKKTDYFVFAKRTVAADYPKNVPATFIFNYAQLEYVDRRIEDVSGSIRKFMSDKKTLVHIGAFSEVRGWPQLLKAMAIMQHDLDLLVIGTIAEGKNALMAVAEKLGINNRVSIIDRVNFSEMFDYLLCADIGCMVYQPGIINHTYAFPMKLYDYMLAGLPVIGPDFSVEVRPVIEGERIGYAVDVSNPNAIAEKLDVLCASDQARKEMGRRARDAVIRKYNWKSQEKRLINIYKQAETT